LKAWGDTRAETYLTINFSINYFSKLTIRNGTLLLSSASNASDIIIKRNIPPDTFLSRNSEPTSVVNLDRATEMEVNWTFTSADDGKLIGVAIDFASPDGKLFIAHSKDPTKFNYNESIAGNINFIIYQDLL